MQTTASPPHFGSPETGYRQGERYTPGMLMRVPALARIVAILLKTWLTTLDYIKYVPPDGYPPSQTAKQTQECTPKLVYPTDTQVKTILPLDLASSRAGLDRLTGTVFQRVRLQTIGRIGGQ
jgi:hypothetical protein